MYIYQENINKTFKQVREHGSKKQINKNHKKHHKESIIGGRTWPVAEQAAITVVFSLSAPGVTCDDKNKNSNHIYVSTTRN